MAVIIRRRKCIYFYYIDNSDSDNYTVYLKKNPLKQKHTSLITTDGGYKQNVRAPSEQAAAESLRRSGAESSRAIDMERGRSEDVKKGARHP